MRVLHVLANSSPDVNGYAVRTQMIHQNQPQDVVGLTSPWYPQRETMIDNFTNNGVEYLRTVHPLHSKKKLSFGLNLVKRQAIKNSGKNWDEGTLFILKGDNRSSEDFADKLSVFWVTAQ